MNKPLARRLMLLMRLFDCRCAAFDAADAAV
jgi:hypothetical protein